MARKRRDGERFTEFGHMEAKDICPLPGSLDDISVRGCKVRFPLPVDVDMDGEFMVQISLPNQDTNAPLNLVCHPQWKFLGEGGTVIGFSFLRSPDTPLLKKYIQNLSDKAEQHEEHVDDVYSMLIKSQPMFVG